SEARFRGVFESDVLPMSFWTADGKITDANDAYLRMVGYTREELEAGKLKWNELTVSDYLHLDHAAIRELKQSGYCRPYEKEYQLRDGRRIPVLLAGAVLPGPAEHGIAFTIDLTERRRAQQALEQSERRFRGIFESATVAIWEADFSDVLAEIVRVRGK